MNKMNIYWYLKLLTFILFLFCASTLSAQFAIENAAGDIGTSPTAEDINVCFEQQDALTFRIIGLPGGTDPTLSIELATGREYIDGSITIVNQSGSLSLGANIGTANNPEFQINGTFNSGDFAEISLNRVGTCEAINQNGLTETVTIDGETEISTTHDALFLTLSMGGFNTPTVAIGDMTTLTGQIIGGGNGCVEEIVFAVIDDVGLLTTELRVEGNTLTADSTSGNILYYTIGLAEISQVGDNDDCLEALEVLTFERDVQIISCEVAVGYEASWGCFGETCITTGFLPQQVNIAAGLPNMTSSFNNISPSNTCDNAVVEVTFSNNGTENQSNAGTAFDVIAKLGAASSEGGIRGGQRLGTVSISDGMGGFTTVSFTGGDPLGVGVPLEIDMSQFLADPDGSGGLDDLDGDGQFDDLRVGESVTIRYEWEYICFGTECGMSHSGTLYAQFCFNDQCDNSLESGQQFGTGFTNRFWSGVTESPTDVWYQEPDFDVEFCYSGQAGNFLGQVVNCPDALTTHVLVKPPGFNLTGATYAGGTVVSSVEMGDSIVVLTNWGGRTDISLGVVFCLTLSLRLDCDAYNGNNQFSYNNFFECDPGACDCKEGLYCDDFDLLVHCPKKPGDPVPGGFTIQAPDFERVTTGFVDATSNERVDPDTLTEEQLNIVMPCDTVIGTYFGTHTADSLGLWLDNAHLWLQYDLIGGNTILRAIDAEVEIYDDSTPGSLLQTCAVGLPDEDLTDGVQHNILWDISASCGHTFGPNDSMSMKVTWVVEKNASLTDIPNQLPNCTAQFFSINENGDRVSCGIWGVEIKPHSPQLGRYDGGVMIANGCTSQGYGSTISWSGGPTDPYPGEVRPYYCLDSFAIVIVGGDQLDLSQTVRYIAHQLVDVGLSAITTDVSALAEPNGDGSRIVFRNDGTWPRADLGGTGATVMNIIFNITNSCQSDPTGRISLEQYYNKYCYANDETCFEPFVSIVGRDKINNLPEHEILDLSGLQSISQDTVCWTVQVRNITNVPSANIFLLLDEMASAGIDIIAAQDVTPDTALTLTPYANGEFIPVAVDFGAAATKDIKITGVINDCFRDSIPVLLGYDCVSFPADPTTYPCELDSTYLYVRPLQSQVQIELEQEAAPYDICSIIEDTVTITSALDAYITDLELSIPLPAGLTENDLIAVIEYPAESGTTHMVSITVVSGASKDTVIIDLMQHPDIMSQGGIPGTQDAGTAQEAQARVFLDWITDCDFLAGDTYAPVINANRPCGDPAIGNGTSTNSDPIAINGAAPPYLATVEPTISIDTIMGCVAEMVSVSSSIVLGTTTDQDTTFITLPEGVSYVSNSFMCTLATPADPACVEFVEVRTIGNQEQVVLKVPSGINGPTELPYEFAIIPQPDGLCNETGILNIDMVTTASGIACATTGMNCPGINILMAQAQDTLFFQKPELSFDNAAVCRQGSMYQISGELSTSTMDVAADETLTISVYCSSDLSTTVGTITINGPVVEGSPVFFSEMISASCPSGDSFYLNLNPMDGNCICQNVGLAVPITPEATAMLTPVEGTCNGSIPNNDATITISSGMNGEEAGISLGAIYSGPAYGDAANIDVSSGSGSLMNLMHNTQYTVRIFNTAGCFVDFTVTTPDIIVDAGKTLEICNDAGTNFDPSDDYITFSLNPTGSVLGATYAVTADNGGIVTLVGSGAAATGVSYGSPTAFRLQDGSADGLTTYTITVTDVDDEICTTMTTVMQASCSPCILPTISLTSNEGTCSDMTPNNDATITMSSAMNGDEAGISMGSTYTGSAYGNAANIDVSGSTGAFVNLIHNTVYTVRIFNGANDCFVDETLTTADLSCFVCPTLSNPTTSQTICEGQTLTTLSVDTDANTPNQIEFVYFSTQQSGNAMYTGGTSLGTVSPNAGSASISDVGFPMSGIYYVYAILQPTPTAVDCRPFQEIIVTVEGCDFTVFLPDCEFPPCHFIRNDIYLGAGVSTDNDAMETTADDGANFPNNIRPNITIRIPVTVYNNTGQTAYLSAWIDWNGDGDFEDVGEQIASETYPSVAPNTGSFQVSLPTTVPSNAVQDSDIRVRFRLSTDDLITLSPCGVQSCAGDGEVEDYFIQVECPPMICVPVQIQLNKGE